MIADFEIASGSVTGRDHVVAGRNNQDAVGVWTGPEAIVAVVADGCGSGRHSEVGAQLGARLVAESLRRHLPHLGAWPVEAVLEHARLDVLAELQSVAAALGGSLSQTVSDYLLFTIVGAVLTEDLCLVFALGDGVTAVNGQADVVAYPGNEPPYLAYGLTGCASIHTGAAAERFTIKQSLPTRDVSSLLIGTDGVADLVRAADRCLPGRSETVGPLRCLWEQDRFFRNPANLTRRLTLINRDTERIDWDGRRATRDHGLLPDDTTLVALRRR